MNAHADKITIGLAGTFTIDPLAKHLKETLSNKNTKFLVAPYNQVNQLSFDPKTVLGGDTDCLVILWRLEDIGFAEVDNFIGTIKTLRKNYSGTLIVSNCSYPNTAEFNNYDLQQPVTGLKNYNTALNNFTTALQEIENIQILNLSGLMNDFGLRNAHDARKWYLYKQPYAEDFIKIIAQQIGRIIYAQTTAAKKCIVLDCDDTLWGGLIGEDSIGGIEIGQDFPGSAFQDFQKYLLHLRSKGILLAIASKNDEENIFNVFDNHDAMILKRDHISAWQVHWNSKADSIIAIAKELNIGTDSIVFIDDSAKEIGEVNERLPEVECFLVPEETADLPALLTKTDLFDVANLSEEDSKRAEMMQAETKRTKATNSMSAEEFIKSLDLKINIFEAQPQHLGRITQLINKTNQFNLTTIRRTADEVAKIANDSDYILLGMDITDRFGEYGLVGVAILKKSNNTDWTIDSLLMSCRVLGRGAETAFLAKISEAISKRGGNKLIGSYIPTSKNKLVKNLYADHGFKADGDKWVIEALAIKQPSDYVYITLEMAS